MSVLNALGFVLGTALGSVLGAFIAYNILSYMERHRLGWFRCAIM